jgi:PAS domain S-box-containing protein
MPLRERTLLTRAEWQFQHVREMPHRLQGVDVSFVDSLVVPASLHDLEGRFEHMNAAAERASGRSNAQLIRHHFTEMLLPEERNKVVEQVRRAADGGEPTDFETLFLHASGELRGVRAQHLPLRPGEAIAGVLILAFGAHPPPASNGVEAQPRLTPRQREVLDLIASGLSTSEIAEQLTVSTETVRNHVRSIFRELDAHSRLEAIVKARRLGLLAPPPLDTAVATESPA